MTALAKLRLTVVVAAIIALVAGGLYFFGLLQGRGEINAQRTDYERRLELLEGENHRVRSRLAAELARGLLYRSTVELDRRNFGTASEHLKEAATALASADPRDAGLDASKLTAARQSIENLNISVAENLESQRAQVLQAAARLDELLKQ